MKKLLLILLGVLIANFQLVAKPINAIEAKIIASSHSKYLKDKSDNLLGISEQRLIATSQEIFDNSNNEIKANTNPTFYVFTNDNNNGYVIVSADDIARPVLGYSNSGSFSVTDLPENFKWWLSEYDREIAWAISNKIIQSNETAKEWKQYKEGNFGNEIQSEVVSPLIKSKWAQDAPYNNLCPLDYDSSKRALTGCSATAMAQIMNYWEYPEQGAGYHSYVPKTNKKYGNLSASFANTTYDWDNMSNEYDYYSTSTQKSAIATLMYHCGVALEMNYGVDVSGAWVTDYALENYFLYDNSCVNVKRSNYTNSQWIALVKNELDNMRPMEYNGFYSINDIIKGGHSFVCDGYNSDNYFHFNFGWSGNKDNWMFLNAINPGSGGAGSGDGTYNLNQGGTIGIKPPQGMGAKIAVYKEFIMNQPSIWVNSKLKIKVNFQNVGVESFSGTIGLALYDSLGQYVMYLGEQEVGSLSPGYVFKNSIEFESEPLYGTKKGRYYVAALYKPSAATNWLFVKNDDNLQNLLQINIGSAYYNNSIITLYSEPEVNPSIVEQGADFYVAASFYNSGDRTFYGTIKAFIYDLNDNLIKEISYLSESEGLPSNYHYTNPIKFYGDIGDIPIGDYYVGFQAFETNSSWIPVNSGEYTHLKRFTIISAPVQKDQYENNNTISFASDITPNSFSSNINTINIDATLHENDVDFYKLNLPKGYDFSITSKLLDQYTDAQYGIDAIYSIKKDNSDWSESFDTDQNTPILCENGGTLVFNVLPYFTGQTGTYRLKIVVLKKGVTAVENDKLKKEFSIIPSVAKESVNIYSSLGITPESIKIYNLAGAIVYQTNEKTISTIDISTFAVGRYLVEILANGKFYQSNFVKE